MKITAWETLSCDAGWRNYHFLKLTTDQGVVGWSEFDEPRGVEVARTIEHLGGLLIGAEVAHHEKVRDALADKLRSAPRGMTPLAIGAIENALLDAKAKLLGVPVYELLGGSIREAVPVYWSHCSSWRIEHPSFYAPAIHSLEGVVAAGEEARCRGFTALKTNMYLHDDEGIRRWTPGRDSPFESTLDHRVLSSVRSHLEALREGAGGDVEIMVDLNFNVGPGDFPRLIEALADLELSWIEIDLHNPKALAEIRRRSPAPISSGETLVGIRQFLPYLSHRAVDVAVVDAVWNGVWQAMKIASLADAHDVNVAPHNYYSHLATMMSLHLAAATPNLQVLETDVDRIPWDSEFFDAVPTIVNGSIVVPDLPGWGIELNEAAIRARPPKQRRL